MIGLCEICGKKDILQKHHVTYIPEVIQNICVSCHESIHGHGVGKASWISIIESNKATLEEVKAMFDVGTTNKEICKKFGVSYATASHWRKKLGYSKPKDDIRLDANDMLGRNIPIKKKVIGYSNSIGIVIPKAVTEAYDIEKGDVVLIDILEITKPNVTVPG